MEARLEGNNGGDYLTIAQQEENTVYIELGSSCVHIFRGVVPVEFLTHALTEAITASGGVGNYLMSTGWDRQFREKLCADIRQDYPLPHRPQTPKTG